MKSAWIIAGAVAATVTLSTVGYLAYFDHKRRSDPEFRKKLSTSEITRSFQDIL